LVVEAAEIDGRLGPCWVLELLGNIGFDPVNIFGLKTLICGITFLIASRDLLYSLSASARFSALVLADFSRASILLIATMASC
jgi:hypothetical protein